MEFIERKTVPDVSTGGQTFSLDFAMPPSMIRWSFHILPKHAGGAITDPTAAVEYFVDGAFRAVNPNSVATAPVNKASTITREDGIGRVRVVLNTDAGGGPDGGLSVELFGDRS